MDWIKRGAAILAVALIVLGLLFDTLGTMANLVRGGVLAACVLWAVNWAAARSGSA